jgi:uracil-DNA glycosylase
MTDYGPGPCDSCGEDIEGHTKRELKECIRKSGHREMGILDYDTLDSLAKAHLIWREAVNLGHAGLSKVYVPGEGDDPACLIVGEAPGAQEEARRRPFVGPAGIVLRELMAIANLHTKDWQRVCSECEGKGNYQNCEYCGGRPRMYGLANCWLTNVVKFRPPGNRNPTAAEIASVRKLLHVEWVAVGSPAIVVAVGSIALKAILGKKVSILRVAGKPMSIINKAQEPMVIWPMIHPSFALREQNKAMRPLIEKDWINFRKWLQSPDSAPYKGPLYQSQDW